LRVPISYSHIGLVIKVGYSFGFIGSFVEGLKSPPISRSEPDPVAKVINNEREVCIEIFFEKSVHAAVHGEWVAKNKPL
jgi:hypothetical protein